MDIRRTLRQMFLKMLTAKVNPYHSVSWLTPRVARRRRMHKLLSVICYLTLFLTACVLYESQLLNARIQSGLVDQKVNRVAPVELSLTPVFGLPGDMGHPVAEDLNSTLVRVLVKKGLQDYGYNQYAADLMSVRRRLPDVRASWCRASNRYLSNHLPDTSIVIVFYDEAWSVLIRTVHSILERTPDHLIREIVLVDDFSTKAHLKTRLEDYFAQFPKVRIVRAPKRLGLIVAKVFGAKASSARFITFLDAHVECTTGWLEPLLSVVKGNETTIAIPTIDQIDPITMQLRTDFGPRVVGAYRWDLNFGWWGRSAMKKRYSNPYVPFDTPAMAGGLFTISRAFFERLGWYDEGFDIYGIENIELSMKSWMCGGKMVIVPCSRVAHIQKVAHPYLERTLGLNVIMRNSLRLAEVWMDEYAQVIFDVYGIPHYLEDYFGSVETRKKIRQQAQCGTFRDYVLRGFPEMMNPLVPGAFRGEVRNGALSADFCLTRWWTNNSVAMARCDGQRKQQFWTHNYYHELNNYSSCIGLPQRSNNITSYRPHVTRCHRRENTLVNQRWHYELASKQIRQEKMDHCLAVDGRDGSSYAITIEPCSRSKRNQKWFVNFVKLDVSIFRFY